MAFRRKQREMVEMQEDTDFPFYVGRLVGAAEMCSHWLSLQQGNDAKEMGRSLNAVTRWFLTEDVVTPVMPPSIPPPKAHPKGMNP
jgi:hypothetical protein